MLVLSRKIGETIHIGDFVTVTILNTRGQVKVGIEAPRDVRVLRGELARHDAEPAGMRPPATTAGSS